MAWGITSASHNHKRSLLWLTFLKETQNLLLLGSSGTGKTHLATALGVKACEKGYEVRFFRVADLVEQLEEALQAGTLQRLKRQIDKCDLLILDEVGYVPFGKQGSELLFHIIADCYERKSVIVTSNLQFGQWNRIFRDHVYHRLLLIVWFTMPILLHSQGKVID